MKSSLKTKSLILVFIILSAVLAINTAFLSLSFVSFQKNSLQNQVRMIGEHLRDELSRAVNLGLNLESLEGLNESCHDIVENNKEIGYCMLVNTENRVLFHNDPLSTGRFLRDPASVAAARSRGIMIQKRNDDDIEYYDISIPVFDSEQKLLGSLRLGLKYAAVSEKVYPLLWESVAVALLTFILAAVVVSIFVNRKVVAPIIEMAKTASLIAQGDWSRRLDINSQSEIGHLAESFNRMAESIKDREERVQQGFKDLEKANDELQYSYVQLENTAGELELKSQHLNEKVGELSFLHDATDRLRQSMDLDDILSSAAKDITEEVGYDRVLLALVNEQTRTLEEKISIGMGGKERELLSEPLDNKGIFAAAVKERSVQYVAQASLDSRISAKTTEQLSLNEFAIIPMVGKDRCVGVILVDNRRTMKPMRRDKLDILATFASTAAMAVENAYLYRQLMENLETVERANKELRMLDQTKTNFLSLASHELRTPLVSVMGYLNLMIAGDLGEITGEQLEMLEIATKGASRLRDIVEDLLIVAKIEGGRLPLKLRWISMAEVISASLDEVRPFLNQRNVDIKISSLDLLPKLEADFDRLQQCMTNLIGNAVKFTPDGGSINLSGRKVKIDKKTGHLNHMPFDNSILSADTYIEVVVEDTGIGIARDHLEKIFDKFFEVGDVDAHSTGKVKFLGGGTGLGLSIVRGIVTAHNGQIWAESEGEDAERCPGSRFIMLLPMKQPAAKVDLPLIPEEKAVEPALNAKKDGDDQHKRTVLLVEDDEDTVIFTKLILEKKFNVMVARDGFEGLKKAFNEKPEAILIDVWMRGLDGFEVCRILKDNSHTADIPVAMFTAAAQKHELEKGFAAGANDYITKPFTSAELTQRVEKLLGSKAAEVS